MSYMIDKEGKPYVEGESFPCGGGLDKRCSHNDTALYCYYTIGDRYAIYEYLRNTGWDEPIHSDDSMEIWEKDDTKIYFESYSDRLWGYMTTEYVGATTENETAKDPGTE